MCAGPIAFIAAGEERRNETASGDESPAMETASRPIVSSASQVSESPNSWDALKYSSAASHERRLSPVSSTPVSLQVCNCEGERSVERARSAASKCCSSGAGKPERRSRLRAMSSPTTVKPHRLGGCGTNGSAAGGRYGSHLPRRRHEVTRRILVIVEDDLISCRVPHRAAQLEVVPMVPRIAGGAWVYDEH